MAFSIPRRDFLYGLGSSLGALALTDLCAAEEKKHSGMQSDPYHKAGPLVPKSALNTPKAKAVIMLFMEGGPSQADVANASS